MSRVFFFTSHQILHLYFDLFSLYIPCRSFHQCIVSHPWSTRGWLPPATPNLLQFCCNFVAVLLQFCCSFEFCCNSNFVVASIIFLCKLFKLFKPAAVLLQSNLLQLYCSQLLQSISFIAVYIKPIVLTFCSRLCCSQNG